MCHGDDILVGIETDDEAEDVKSALVSRAAKHPAGPFKLKMIEVIQLGTPNDYLGYMFRHRPKEYGGGARASASRKAILRCQRRLACKLALTAPSHDLGVAEVHFRRWVKSFGAWGAGQHAVDFAMLDLWDEVLSVVCAFRKHLDTNKLTFNSLAEALGLFEKEFLPSVGKQWAMAKATAKS